MPATGNKNIVGLNSILYTANKNLSVYGHWVLKRRQNFASGICCLFFFFFFVCHIFVSSFTVLFDLFQASDSSRCVVKFIKTYRN